jgi:hypothetical protein
MYGMVFFLTQFLQDIQGHSALITGLAFLPAPVSVFLSSQLVSKVLIGRVSTKALMVGGSALSAAGLLVVTQLHTGTTYLELLPALVLMGTGLGTSFVSLTTAALHGVAPADSGAASGVINVTQQLGAALGLAVLVTVFDAVTSAGRSSGLGQALGAAARAALVHGLDVTVAVGAAFSLAALAIVLFGVPSASVAEKTEPVEVALDAAA